MVLQAEMQRELTAVVSLGFELKLSGCEGET